jgi:hypothetical protein
MIANVFPCNSIPAVVFDLVCNRPTDEVECPELIATFFDKTSIRKRVCSATEIALASGTFAT